MEWWIWLAGGMLLLVVEILTPGLFFLFFAIGAMITGLAAAIGLAPNLALQALLFAGISVTSVALFRKPLVARMQAKSKNPHMDDLVGETAVLEQPVAPGEFGQAELRGTTWKVRNVGGLTLTPGQRCTVQQVDGLTLYIRAEG